MRIVIKNNYLPQDEPTIILEEIYKSIVSLPEFIKCGEYRIVFCNIETATGLKLNYHPNCFINKDTTLDDYKKQVLPYIKEFLWDSDFSGYEGEDLSYFILDIYGIDSEIKNKSSTIRYKTPISKRGKQILQNIQKRSYVTNQIVTDKINFDKYIISTKCDDETSKFITLDIETQGNNHLQEVTYVSAYKGYGIGKVFTGYKVWEDVITWIKDNCFDDKSYVEPIDNIVVFVHNLGSFDGYFIFKGLVKLYGCNGVSCIKDQHNKFVSITLSFSEKSSSSNFPKIKSIIFKDSYRIFPVSLNDLCSLFEVEGKLKKYVDVKPNEMSDYCLQDSKALFDALKKAQSIYYNNHDVDLVKSFSTSSLSMSSLRQVSTKIS